MDRSFAQLVCFNLDDDHLLAVQPTHIFPDLHESTLSPVVLYPEVAGGSFLQAMAWIKSIVTTLGVVGYA